MFGLVTWQQHGGGTYTPPAELTAIDQAWLAGHLRLAGLSPVAPAVVRFMSVEAAARFMRRHFDPGLVGTERR